MLKRLLIFKMISPPGLSAICAQKYLLYNCYSKWLISVSMNKIQKKKKRRGGLTFKARNYIKMVFISGWGKTKLYFIATSVLSLFMEI